MPDEKQTHVETLAAELDADGNVLRVIVVEDPQWAKDHLGGTWIAGKSDGSIGKNAPGVGYAYDQKRQAFIAPPPDQDHVLDEKTCRWMAPDPKDGSVWSDESFRWVSPEEFLPGPAPPE